MKRRKAVALVLSSLLVGACADLEVVNQNDPDRGRALASPGDVEALIAGGFQSWWGTSHHSFPASALSVAADAHSSSWGNWGMRDSGQEPRQAYNNSPSYGNNNMAESPWTFSYRSLVAVRDGFLAIENGTRIQDEGGPDNTDRALAFGKLIQALSLANVAVVFDRGFIIDETVDDVANAELIDYNAVWDVADAKFGEAIQMAAGGGFTIPSEWVGYDGEWSGARMEEIARAYRARYRTQVARMPSERELVDWSAVLRDANAGISATYGGNYTAGGNWAWHRSKLHTATWRGWARIDYRTIGPSDASGEWERWINASPNEKTPFDIDTDDQRVAGVTDTTGHYILYMGNSPFPADRGIYHYSNYIDFRWDHLRVPVSFIGKYPDLTQKELDFLAAEASYRLGDRGAAMATVNKYRTEKGGLPPFTDPNGPAPGGTRCVPQMPDGSCGDLWEALKYEKRIELFHYGFGTEYFDDRGWGDLVPRTWEQLPIPGSELEILLIDMYTFGGDNAGSAPSIVDRHFLGDVSPAAIKAKRAAMEAIRERTMERPDDHVGVRRW